MSKIPLSLLSSCALAVCAGSFAPAASYAQQIAAASSQRAPGRVATPPPPVTVAAGDQEEANEPSPPLDTDVAAEGSTETNILCDDGATFASKDRIAVFMGNVRVTDPRFQLACDKLTVFLNKSPTAADSPGAPATAGTAGKPAPATKGNAAAPAPTPGSTGGIDHALAEGHVVIVQERAATPGGEAKRSVGRADWGNFDNKSGDMVLKGTPSVQQNENTLVALSPDTVITLRRDNSMTTTGPSKTTIVQRKSADLTGNGAPAAGQSGQAPATPGQPGAGGRRTRGTAPSAAPSPTAAGTRS